MLTVGIEGDGSISANAVRDITTPHTGTTAYLHISRNGSNNNNYAFQINGKGVKYISGAEVKAGDISDDDNLVLTYAKDSDSAGFWLLLNKVNTASYSGGIQTTQPASLSDAKNGLMSAMDKAKLDSMDWGATKNASYELQAATTSQLGGVMLGRTMPNNSLVDLGANTTSTTSGKYYAVGAAKDGKLVVNVPWTDNSHYTASIIAGGENDTGNTLTNETQDTYIHILDKEGNTVRNNTKVKLVGDGSVHVSSDDSGNINIRGVDTTYPMLLTNNYNANHVSGTKYTVNGPGPDNATTSNFLRGNGTWGPVVLRKLKVTVGSSGQTSAVISNSGTYHGGYITLKPEDNSATPQFRFFFGGTVRGVQGQSLNLNQLMITAPTAAADNTYFIQFFPIDNYEFKPGLIRLNIVTTVSNNNVITHTASVSVQ